MTNRQLLANALRVLAIDATEQAQSGHPGMPLGMADIAQVLWGDFLRHNPRNPHWLNRDRFVLSNGHGSMLLYALLHLTGYALSLEDLRHFRQLHSKTPGHPEYHVTPGVETTTGPLGQGLANAVGMALAERSLAQAFNRPSHTVIDHHTYVFLGDGCLMEGISHEACSLAGTLGLGKLIACWDDNGISIDGPTSGWFSEDVAQRFTAYGWQVLTVDGHDAEAIRHAFIAAQAETARPSLLCCKTVIGYGAPQAAGSAKVHGAPLGAAESRAAKQALGWDLAPFSIPAAVASAWDACSVGAAREQAWQTQFNAYRDAYPALADELLRRMQGQLPAEWNAQIEQLVQDTYAKQETVATRKASLHCLQALLPVLPELLGGSADLSESNCTFAPGHTALSREQAGNYVHYGVREFAMAAIMNGLALHGGFIPYGGTFLTFVDYARNAVRMAALMQQRVIFVLTHDSIGLGEDGPTHQPVEHIAMLRVTPNVTVWRPCDSVETAVAWRHAVENQRGPTCLLLSRQALPYQARSAMTLAQVSRGGYILRDSAAVQLIIMATGSEVALACAAAERLTLQGYGVRVVSMPSVEVFAQQDAAYRAAVLPAAITKRMAVEAGVSDIWYKYVGLNGCVVGLDRFGESAPAPQVFAYLGFSVENIVAQALVLLAD